ncbi:MAG: hypothetical protein ACL93V_07125 [Candidatus Electrothrix sp. YB6]
MPNINWDEMTDLFKCQRAFNEMDKALAEQGRGVQVPLLQDSPEKEEKMELQQGSKEYKEFLRVIECLAEADDWAHYKHYKRFYKDNEDRQEMLLLAVFHGKIKYKFRKEHWSAYGDMDNIDDQKNIIEHCLNGGLTGVSKERKEAFESSFYEPRPSPLLLKAESFLSWLKEEYPYEGEEQAKAEPKENDSAPSLSPKRESNLLKIIGGFVQTVYLKKDTGKYRIGDKPNSSAIAEAFQEELTKVGYSDKGFQNSSLRKIISDALEQIKENKKQENKNS